MSTVRDKLAQFANSELNMPRFPPDEVNMDRKTVARLVQAFLREHDETTRVLNEQVCALRETQEGLVREISALMNRLEEANKTVKVYEVGIECALMAYARLRDRGLKRQEEQDAEQEESALYKEFYEAWAAFIEAASHFVNSDYESASKRWSRARKALAEHYAAMEARA